MRKLTIGETAAVGGGVLAFRDVAIGSGNGIASGNHVTVENVGNGNKILNGSLNNSLNGTGLFNFSGNSSRSDS